MAINHLINTILIKGGYKHIMDSSIYGGGTSETQAQEQTPLNHINHPENEQEEVLENSNNITLPPLPPGQPTNGGEAGIKKEDDLENSLQQIAMLEDILFSYKDLIKNISNSKEKILRLRENSKRLADKKHDLDTEIQQITPVENNSAEETTGYDQDMSQLKQGISVQKESVKAKSCTTVIANVKHIQEHIVTNSEKAESYLEPLSLSCNLLRTHVKYTRSLEYTLKELQTQQELRNQYEESNAIIEMLAVHLGLKMDSE